MSNIFWVTIGILVIIFAAGLFIWTTRKPQTKPNLAMRLDETEAQILGSNDREKLGKEEDMTTPGDDKDAK